MAQRSEGVFPREKFDLDTELQVYFDNSFTSTIPLNSVNTWRIVVLGAAGLGTGGEGGYVRVYTGQKTTDLYSEDLDPNGVGIAYVRGSSIEDGQNDHWYDLYNGATVESVWLDVVDNVG